MMPSISRRLALSTAVLAAAFAPAVASAADVNIYTSRQPELIQPLLDAFTEESGLTTATIFIDKGLEERIAAEGANSPADVIMTVDIGRLDAGAQATFRRRLGAAGGDIDALADLNEAVQEAAADYAQE